MLVLNRRSGESIRIGSDVTITIGSLSKSRVSICVDAPDDVTVLRTEVMFEVGELPNEPGFQNLIPRINSV